MDCWYLDSHCSMFVIIPSIEWHRIVNCLRQYPASQQLVARVNSIAGQHLKEPIATVALWNKGFDPRVSATNFSVYRPAV